MAHHNTQPRAAIARGYFPISFHFTFFAHAKWLWQTCRKHPETAGFSVDFLSVSSLTSPMWGLRSALTQAISQKRSARWGASWRFPVSWIDDTCSCSHFCWPEEAWLDPVLIPSAASSQDRTANWVASWKLQLLQLFTNISVLTQRSRNAVKIGSKAIPMLFYTPLLIWGDLTNSFGVLGAGNKTLSYIIK